MNVLIINLTRFGDLIQTQPVVSGYKSQGHKVGLVCLENFASAASLLDGVDEVFPFPGAGLLSKLDTDWRDAVREEKEFKARLMATFPPHRTVNLTPSISTRLLTHDLAPQGGDTIGFTVDEFGFNADTSLWAIFLQTAAGSRGASPFNVCDIFRKAAGLMDEGNSLELAKPAASILDQAEALLGSHSVTGAKGYIALQMGASEDRRRWPVEYFVQTAQMVWEKDKLIPVLLGTKGEADLGMRFQAEGEFPSINLIGGTSLSLLAGVLCQCKALLTNDTGTMHLAAGLGVPLCAVFLATAQPWDTGPYRAGNICLEPDMDCHPCEFGKECPNEEACRQAVTPEVMYASLQALLDEDIEIVQGARVWKTMTGKDGLMELVSLSGHGTSDRALWIGIQRAHYLRFFDGTPAPELTGLAQSMSPAFKEELSKVLTSAHDMLFLFSQQCMLLMKNPRPQAKKKVLASWQQLQNILASSYHVKLLGFLWMMESQRVGGEIANLVPLVERYKALFSSLRDEFV